MVRKQRKRSDEWKSNLPHSADALYVHYWLPLSVKGIKFHKFSPGKLRGNVR